MTKSVAIVQSNYVPWKGYFDLINRVDEFMLFDDRQYTSRDWRNRNVVKTARGLRWMTVPVQVSGRFDQRIDEATVADETWPGRHWSILRQAYRPAPCFEWCRRWLEPLYAEPLPDRLSLVNRLFLDAVCSALGIATALTWSADYAVTGTRSERLLNLCRAAGASVYWSGPAARSYLDEPLFHEAGVEIVYMDYSGYPEYPQLYAGFEHRVSVLDLLFNTGPDAGRYLKSMVSTAA